MRERAHGGRTIRRTSRRWSGLSVTGLEPRCLPHSDCQTPGGPLSHPQFEALRPNPRSGVHPRVGSTARHGGVRIGTQGTAEPRKSHMRWSLDGPGGTGRGRHARVIRRRDTAADHRQANVCSARMPGVWSGWNRRATSLPRRGGRCPPVFWSSGSGRVRHVVAEAHDRGAALDLDLESGRLAGRRQ